MKAIIAGGGIGGLSAAIALEHFGIEAEVYEARGEIGADGAGIWLAPNALAIYARLGLDAELRAEGCEYEGAIMISDLHGRSLGRIESQKVRQRFGYVTTSIHRARLHAVLARHVKKAVAGKRCVGYEEHEGGVHALFEDGTRASGDFLIGADGIRAAVRTQLLGEQSYRYSGQTCWRFVAQHELTPEERISMTEVWGDSPGLRAAYGSIGHGEVYVYLTAAAPAQERDDAATLKSTLLDRYRGFPARLLELIEAVPVERILRNDLYDFEPISRWSGGKVVLLGDAAHATTPNLGQGACQAIESAYALGQCLRGESDLSRAFAAYEMRRMKKAHMVTKLSWKLGQMAQVKSPLGRRLYFLSARMTPEWLNERLYGRIYSVDAD